MKCCHEKIHWTKRRTLLVYRSAASTLCFDTNSFSTDWSLHQSELSGRGSFRPAARGGEMCQDTVTFVKRCKFSIKHTILSEWFLIVKALVGAFSRHCESSRSSVDSSTGHQVTFAKLCPVYDVCPGIPCLDTLYIPGPTEPQQPTQLQVTSQNSRGHVDARKRHRNRRGCVIMGTTFR